MSIKKVRTLIGNLNARDGIYIDNILFKDNGQLIMTGEINAPLCSIKYDCDWLKYKMTFEGIIYQALLELDNFENLYPATDNIMEKEESEVLTHIASSISQKGKDCKHYVIFTYDYILDIVSHKFDFEITGKR